MVNDQVRARQRILEIQFLFETRFCAPGFCTMKIVADGIFFDLSFRHASAVPAKKHSVYLQGPS